MNKLKKVGLSALAGSLAAFSAQAFRAVFRRPHDARAVRPFLDTFVLGKRLPPYLRFHRIGATCGVPH